ncbi:YceK/YidQ family lipoprotein [Granulosicoccus antarcticus]|uniref:YceK/YidQ family lipoprotein n=1 Tax=Granulosicoccus antarcticus IMCC3135 TaxID=1192854 RepID=A0A2Z2P9Z2_9GAMM|nr:YceK/YidQ family lipoprotein [Granulosicoccus antarcticus]ASJ76704.1 hypothetical protein IMCC3135_33300 [Granulosicoccus antarcticus IMCC3135]
MDKSKRLKATALCTLLVLTSGCATISTLNQPLRERKPLVMSGLRLDLASLRDDPVVTDRFGVPAPSYPLLDLPFSTGLDILLIGYTAPVALYYRYR